jgi:hypothetical protein
MEVSQRAIQMLELKCWKDNILTRQRCDFQIQLRPVRRVIFVIFSPIRSGGVCHNIWRNLGNPSHKSFEIHRLRFAASSATWLAEPLASIEQALPAANVPRGTMSSSRFGHRSRVQGRQHCDNIKQLQKSSQYSAGIGE